MRDPYRQTVLNYPMHTPLLVTATGAVGESVYFTKGKKYEAFKERADLVVLNVRDDKGNPRVIILGNPCPHFPPPQCLQNRTVRDADRVQWRPAEYE